MCKLIIITQQVDKHDRKYIPRHFTGGQKKNLYVGSAIRILHSQTYNKMHSFLPSRFRLSRLSTVMCVPVLCQSLIEKVAKSLQLCTAMHDLVHGNVKAYYVLLFSG